MTLQNNGLGGQVESLRNQVRTLIEEKQGLEEENGKLRREDGNLKDALRIKEGEIDRLEKSLEEKERDIGELQRIKDRVESHLEECIHEVEASETRWCGAIQEPRSELLELDGKKTDTARQINAMKELKNKFGGLLKESELTSLDSICQTVQEELTKIEDQIALKKKCVDDLNENCENWKTLRESLHNIFKLLRPLEAETGVGGTGQPEESFLATPTDSDDDTPTFILEDISFRSGIDGAEPIREESRDHGGEFAGREEHGDDSSRWSKEQTPDPDILFTEAEKPDELRAEATGKAPDSGDTIIGETERPPNIPGTGSTSEWGYPSRLTARLTGTSMTFYEHLFGKEMTADWVQKTVRPGTILKRLVDGVQAKVVSVAGPTATVATYGNTVLSDDFQRRDWEIISVEWSHDAP